VHINAIAAGRKNLFAGIARVASKYVCSVFKKTSGELAMAPPGFARTANGLCVSNLIISHPAHFLREIIGDILLKQVKHCPCVLS
jgi:hypothetical protein